jgi:hypothetical protein
LRADDIAGFVAALGMRVIRVADGASIPGSYWGDDEAGLIGDELYVRGDTPVHSLLHELCHWLCMDRARRAALHTNAHPIGDDIEENATCYLQCLLADRLPGYSRTRCFADMEAWGYSFVLGSAAAWFERDSEDAQAFLRKYGLIDAAGGASGQRRLT